MISTMYNKTTLAVAPQLSSSLNTTQFSHTTCARRNTTTSRFFPPHHPLVLNHKLLHAAAREYLWENAVDHLERGARSWSARKNPKKLALRSDIVEEIEDGFSILYWKKE
ncbi:MAG: hypothetical protein LQ350_005922 [Teloschistes chrysophthalmus]|nr:MAG: hypothetical protein LQ350_005922 [Niorma chrysophthalma]